MIHYCDWTFISVHPGASTNAHCVHRCVFNFPGLHDWAASLSARCISEGRSSRRTLSGSRSPVVEEHFSMCSAFDSSTCSSCYSQSPKLITQWVPHVEKLFLCSPGQFLTSFRSICAGRGQFPAVYQQNWSIKTALTSEMLGKCGWELEFQWEEVRWLEARIKRGQWIPDVDSCFIYSAASDFAHW